MGIGTALIDPPRQALLLFPFGLRMGILLQSPYRFWPGILLADLLLMALLADQFGYGPALWASVAVLVLTVLLSLLASPWLLRHQQSDSEWRWPLLQGAVVAAAALLQALVWQLVSGEGARALLLGLTGGFTIAPTCLLLWHYLARQIWVPLEPGLIHKPVELRLGHGQLSAAVCVQHLAAAAGERRRAAPFRAVLPGHSYRIHVLPLRLAGCAVGDAAQRRGADGQRAAAAGVAPRSAAVAAGPKPDRVAVGGRHSAPARAESAAAAAAGGEPSAGAGAGDGGGANPARGGARAAR